ncbi:MAG: PRD domain-containing protein [Tissierellia bacterium]|nr:PRD domain-containing protein [Tissierellia bacterium]
MIKVRKVLNNNALLTVDTDSQEEIIYIGNGVGFGQYINKEFTPRPKDKAYRQDAKVDLISAVSKNDPIYLEIGSLILEEARKEFGEIDQKILLSLSDHIAFAVHRMKNNMTISNPFYHDIVLLFEREYRVAQRVKDIIYDKINIDMCEEELGYITLHIHSARGDDKVSDGMLFAVIINESIREIEGAMGLKVDVTSLAYSRLLTHLKYLIARINKEEKITLNMDEFTKKQFPKAYETSEKVIKKMGRILNKKISQIEIGYLALHIQRVCMLGEED